MRASGSERASVLAALRRLEFVARADGTYCRPDALCDPYHPVFKQMLARDDPAFPAPPFNEFKWLELLRLAGLQTDVSAELFVRFASSIADEVRRPDQLSSIGPFLVFGFLAKDAFILVHSRL